MVADPYVGSGTSAIAASLEGRCFVGSDLNADYLEIARSRLEDLQNGCLTVRDDAPVLIPSGRERVATTPPHFVAMVASNG
jgi:adenine-specific DNA-methyltransferase